MKRSVSLSVLFLILGLVIGIFIGRRFSAPSFSTKEIRAGGYQFINPLLECEYNQEGYKLNGLDPLHDALESFMKTQQEKGAITSASVYYRDLNNGPWIGVNEHADFSPASLLKLPVLMAYFKQAETDPSYLQQPIVYDQPEKTLRQTYSKSTLEKGKTYTVEELLYKMMQSSDNAALVLLEQHISNNLIDKVTEDLGVETAGDNTPDNFMSVKGYASLYRILYNASYLSKPFSEKVLAMLTTTIFNNGIVAGTPKGMKIAHKYGERGLPDGRQLHDCGIVYYPKSPYLLCVMTRGQEYSKLSETIQKVSAMVYQAIDASEKKK